MLLVQRPLEHVISFDIPDISGAVTVGIAPLLKPDHHPKRHTTVHSDIMKDSNSTHHQAYGSSEPMDALLRAALAVTPVHV